jgi:hypothetical protein
MSWCPVRTYDMERCPMRTLRIILECVAVSFFLSRARAAGLPSEALITSMSRCRSTRSGSFFAFGLPENVSGSLETKEYASDL